MEEVKDSWLKGLVWAKPEKVTKKDDVLNLLKERLVALHMIDMCSLYSGSKTVQRITDWTALVYQPLVKDLKQLIKGFNRTNRFQFGARKALKTRGIALLNQNIKNVMWLSEVSEEKQNKVLANTATWSFYENLARDMLNDLDKLGKSK